LPLLAARLGLAPRLAAQRLAWACSTMSRLSRRSPIRWPAPLLSASDGHGGHLRNSRPFSLEEAEASPREVGPGAGWRASGMKPWRPTLSPPQSGADRGDALLEDELVDSPDGIRSTSPYGLLDQRPCGQPLPSLTRSWSLSRRRSPRPWPLRRMSPQLQPRRGLSRRWRPAGDGPGNSRRRRSVAARVRNLRSARGSCAPVASFPAASP